MTNYTDFYFKPAAGDQIHSDLTLVDVSSSAIYATVHTPDGTPVADAFVLLFETGENGKCEDLIASAFTDPCGCFAFGPLASGKLYKIKIYKNAQKVRQLEIQTE